MRYEVEVKSLLGEGENAQRLKEKLTLLGAQFVSSNKQLNHYFTGNDLNLLFNNLKKHFSPDACSKFENLIQSINDFSVRTREKDNATIFVLKASVDHTTSSNGITRIEFEEKVSLSLDELDQLILKSGFEYQAKWSRDREEYMCKDIAICLDKNAGYGWLAEFEKVVDQENKLEEARNEIRWLMKEVGVKELEQDRLERMFSFYNANWKDYYGTEKVFNLS